MDVEKYTNSKFYYIFEWGYKLIIWNLLSLLIVCLVSCIPFTIFFNIKNQYSINNIEIETNTEIGETLLIEQKNGLKTDIGLREIYGDITEILEQDNKIYFNIGEYQIKINNTDNIKNIEKIEFINEDLIVTTYNKEYNFGKIYNSTIDLQSCEIDGYQNLIIAYENGTTINYGIVLETKATISGVLVIIGLILALFAFIPCYITIFSMIKIYAEDGSAQTFSLYFDRLWDNFKSIYKLELFLIPMTSLFAYGLYSYYYIIANTENVHFIITFAYNLLLICLVCIVLFILNLPMSLGYFRMRSKTIFKFTISMTFKNILFSILYVVLLAIPILLCFLNNFFLPIWFLIGLSLPSLIIYFITSKKYHYLVNNFNKYNENEIYEFENTEI